jgi:predicted nucleic acid-binding protein
MIFADTSIWIEFFKNSKSPISIHLKELMDKDKVYITSITRLEILCGASKKNFALLENLLSAIPTFTTNENSYKKIEKKIQKSIESGIRFGIADLLIAQIVEDHKNGILWSLDSDFKAMQKLSFLKLYSMS